MNNFYLSFSPKKINVIFRFYVNHYIGKVLQNEATTHQKIYYERILYESVDDDGLA